MLRSTRGSFAEGCIMYSETVSRPVLNCLNDHCWLFVTVFHINRKPIFNTYLVSSNATFIARKLEIFYWYFLYIFTGAMPFWIENRRDSWKLRSSLEVYSLQKSWRYFIWRRGLWESIGQLFRGFVSSLFSIHRIQIKVTQGH